MWIICSKSKKIQISVYGCIREEKKTVKFIGEYNIMDVAHFKLHYSVNM